MPRSTSASRSIATPVSQAAQAATPHAPMSDAERAARGRAQITEGQYLDDDALDAFLDSLRISAAIKA